MSMLLMKQVRFFPGVSSEAEPAGRRAVCAQRPREDRRPIRIRRDDGLIEMRCRLFLALLGQ